MNIFFEPNVEYNFPQAGGIAIVSNFFFAQNSSRAKTSSISLFDSKCTDYFCVHHIVYEQLFAPGTQSFGAVFEKTCTAIYQGRHHKICNRE
jgi:hypothetical protein